jgi:AMP deaminase
LKKAATIQVHGREESENATPSDEADELWPRDEQRRTAFYDYAAEKQLSNVEAKLFYQRIQAEKEQGGDAWSSQNLESLARSQTLSGPEVPSRSGSLSRQSTRSFNQGSNAYQSTVPVDFANLHKRHDPGDLAGPGSGIQYPPDLGGFGQETLLLADRDARGHSNHPGLPHEVKGSLLEAEGLHGSGAGIGVGHGRAGFATNDSTVTAELQSIYTDIQKILDIRHKYIRLSLQGPMDNPRDQPGWKIYPPPPEPSWEEGQSAYIGEREAIYMPKSQVSWSGPLSDGVQPQPKIAETSSSKKAGAKTRRVQRKPGQDIGEDFFLEDLLPVPGPTDMIFKLDAKGVYQVYENADSLEHDMPIIHIPDMREFYMDYDFISTQASDGPNKSFAFRRLQYLEGKFNLYGLLNEYQEMIDSKRVPHRDFYNVRKVDTHVHHSACMNQKHLLRFIKSKMKKCPDEVVLLKDQEGLLTLSQVFESLSLTAYDLSIDTLDMHVGLGGSPF